MSRSPCPLASAQPERAVGREDLVKYRRRYSCRRRSVCRSHPCTSTLRWTPTGRIQSGTNTEHVFPVHVFSIQNELTPPIFRRHGGSLKTAASADSTSEMLIYIRHGISTLGYKSAEKLNKAESDAPSPRLCRVSGLPDQRIAAFGKSDQKTGICLEGGKKQKNKKKLFAWPSACGDGNSSGPHWSQK